MIGLRQGRRFGPFSIDLAATANHIATLRLGRLMLCHSFGAGECPEWQRGRTVNPLAYAFVGSSPTSPTSLRSLRELRLGKPCSSLVAKRAKAAAPKPKGRRRACSRATARQAVLVACSEASEGCRAEAQRAKAGLLPSYGSASREKSA